VDTRTLAVGVAALILLLGTSRAASAARTDVIVLRNGDHITGEVEQMRQGKLVVKTDNAGTLSIEWDEVASITTAARYDVTMRDARRLFGRLRPAAAGSLDLVADDGTVTTLPMADIVWCAQIKNTFWDRIDGSMDLGGSYTRSSGVADVAFDVDAEYRRPSDRYSGSFSTNLTRQDQTDEADARTTSRYSLKLNYTKFRGNQWFVAPFGLFEGNRELGFTFRGTGALSAGRYVLQSSHAEVVLAGGMAAGREDPVDASSVTNVDALATFAFSIFNYDYPTTRIDFGMLVFPSLDDPGRVRINADTKLKREIFKDFFISLSAYDAFDNKPKAAAARKNDFGASLSFGWTF
jgi:Protein of unknown function, DUF481